MDRILDLLFGQEKAARIRKFAKTGGGRRQDHGTRGNDGSHNYRDPDWWPGFNGERARRRDEIRHGGLYEETDID